jgi:hypothetical protein
MSDGTIIFVHGTGVRLTSFDGASQNAADRAAASGIRKQFVPCAWGDALGAQFSGLSLPDPPPNQKLKEDEQDFAEWTWLFDDPLFELYTLTIRDTSSQPRTIPKPGQKPKWLELWEKIALYEPSEELRLLLEKNGYERLWSEAWSRIVRVSPIPKQAFEMSANELPDAVHALARALVAQIHVLAAEEGIPCPSRTLRDALVRRMTLDWRQQVYGLGTFFANIVKRSATRALRRHRSGLSSAAALPIGDILLYQSRGADIRKFIRYKIEHAEPPVSLVAHSLGGIACFDLLALPDPPSVAHLVTAGSQSPLFYELGALHSLKLPEQPANFPPWLNLFDRNDFLSYVAHRLFPSAQDVEIESGQPFPDSHSAYFSNAVVWTTIGKFIT